MNKILKMIICLFLSLFIFDKVYALDINSKYAVLYNLDNNQVVYELNKDEKTSIASLTKIMTCITAIENIDDLDGKVTITKEMLNGLIEANAYVIWLRPGQILTYRDLLYATFLPSAADAARGLAISIAGSEDKFVEMMNDKAIELGLSQLHFANVIGLDDIDNYGTVDGVAKLLMYALKNDIFKEIYETKKYTLSDKSMTVESSMRYSADTYNINIDYILGGKTGYTEDAGKCLASTALDPVNNINYLLVTVGAPTTKLNAYHVLDASIIYNYYFKNYKNYYLVNKNDILINIPISFTNYSASIYANKDVLYYSDKNYDESKVTKEFDIVKKISPYTKKNTKIGTVTIKYNNEIIDVLDLYFDEDIKINIFDILSANYKLIIILLLLIICLITVIRRVKVSLTNKSNMI